MLLVSADFGGGRVHGGTAWLMKALPASEWWLRGLQSYGKERKRMKEGRKAGETAPGVTALLKSGFLLRCLSRLGFLTRHNL